MSAAAQYGVNGDVNWEVVGYSALGGAVVRSTGVVGKLQNGYQGYFNLFHMKKKHVITILILVGIMGSIWSLPYLGFYSFKDALIITISAIVGGGIAELVLKNKKH